MFKKLIFIFILFSFSLFPKDKSYLTFGGGWFDLFRENRRTAEFFLEYKSSFSFYKIHPFIGGNFTLKGSSYIYSGLQLDLVLKRRLLISPQLAAGIYFKGKGKDLGCPLEFKSSLFLGWQFDNLSRLGAGMSHVSNASIGNKNPGEESFLIFYSIPF